jgi:hypothetical protein
LYYLYWTGGQLAGLADGEETVTGPAADVMNAAYTAAEVAARMIKPGNTNKQVCIHVNVIIHRAPLLTITYVF